MLEDVGLDLVRRRSPGRAALVFASDMCQPGRAVERHPAHQLGRHVVLRLAACLPDALVGFAPDFCCALRLRLDDRPQRTGQPLASLRVKPHRVEHRAEHVVLALVEGAVADADGMRAGVARQLRAGGLREVAAAVDPVHDLEAAVLVRL